jgi:hypothetical protein
LSRVSHAPGMSYAIIVSSRAAAKPVADSRRDRGLFCPGGLRL